MPAREEARLTTRLWNATRESGRPLVQEEIDAILEVRSEASAPLVPEQRQEPELESWARIRTDAGDERWLNHLTEPHCWEPY